MLLELPRPVVFARGLRAVLAKVGADFPLALFLGHVRIIPQTPDGPKARPVLLTLAAVWVSRKALAAGFVR